MTIWMDVTTILSWNRPVVGIVRTEAECARNFIGYKISVKFCQFSIKRKHYEASSIEEVNNNLDRLDKSHLNYLNNVLLKSDMDNQYGFEDKLRIYYVYTKKILNILPRRIRIILWEMIKSKREVIYGLLSASQGIKYAVRQLFITLKPKKLYLNSKSRNLTNAKALFKRDDVYIYMGLDWDQNKIRYLYDLKRLTGMKIILFCYDIIPIKFPQLFAGIFESNGANLFAHYFADAAWSADHIICISENTRNDLISFLKSIGAPIPQTSVVELGSNLPLVANLEAYEGNIHIKKKKYLLFVSTIERRKNHEVLYRAYIKLIEADMSELPLLVFVGMPGWGVKDLLNDLQIDPRIHKYIQLLNNVSDAELAHLYKNAYFTVYPSLYEGWGLPVAESLAHGKYCLASNSSSIPEVGGNLIDYLDPWDVPSWANKLKFLIDNPAYIKEKEKQISKQYKPMKWQETANDIYTIATKL